VSGDHLWVPTSVSGDCCYVGDNDCTVICFLLPAFLIIITIFSLPPSPPSSHRNMDRGWSAQRAKLSPMLAAYLCWWSARNWHASRHSATLAFDNIASKRGHITTGSIEGRRKANAVSAGRWAWDLMHALIDLNCTLSMSHRSVFDCVCVGVHNTMDEKICVILWGFHFRCKSFVNYANWLTVSISWSLEKGIEKEFCYPTIRIGSVTVFIAINKVLIN
jgi:hypothetical protein